MAKKTKLSIEYIPDFKAIALFSQQKDYRFCWLLNRYLYFDMKRLPDFSYTPYKQIETALFQVYYHEDPANRLYYFLLANKCHEGVLFELPKNMDYLLLIKNPGAGFNLKAIIGKLREMEQLQGAFPLNGGLGKRSDLILYDFEIFTDEVFKK